MGGPGGAGRRWRRPVVALGAGLTLVTGLALAACTTPAHGALGGSTRSASSTTADVASTTSTTPTDGFGPVSPVVWSACGALQCGSVTVPLDYAEPQLGTIQIAVARHPATDPAARIGSLVINPGGPGGSGINDLPNELSVLTPDLLARFDVVSFDPRGVQRSAPVECNPGESGGQGPPGPLPDPVPATAATQQALVGNDEAYAAQCESMSGRMLPFVGTVDTARDLDVIRQALGDPLLTFIGHSYGTLLGATYAQMFPTHVRAMVLDGAIDPALSSAQMIIDQSKGFEGVLDDFFSWCASTHCPWNEGGNPAATLLGLVAASRANPIPGGAGRGAGPGEFYDAMLDALYARSFWPSLGNALAEAAAGNGSAVLALSDAYLRNGSTNAVDAETAIDCVDHPTSRDISSYPSLASEAAVQAPVFGPLLAWGLLGCSVWPVPATRAVGPTTAVGSPPILVVGATKDPATPYVWAQHLASELQHGVLVTWQGENHVAYFYSGCVRSIDQAYLVDGTPPAAGTVCTD